MKTCRHSWAAVVLAWLVSSCAFAQAASTTSAVECFVTDQVGEARTHCDRLHLAAARAAEQAEHARLESLLPRQAHPLLADEDSRWERRRHEACGSPAPADCLITGIQDRTALLTTHRRNWERIARDKAAETTAAAMASASPALDPGHASLVHLFWQWVHSFPDEDAPALDPDGGRCALNQTGPTWFLAGNARGGDVQRVCTVPADKRLMVPVLAVAVPTGDIDGCASTRIEFYEHVAGVDAMDVRMDGQALPRTAWPRMHMDCIAHPDGKRHLLVAGWWLYLEPLATGPHRLEFNASVRALQVQQEVVYQLDVQ